jgi:hypothetical protein
MTIEPTCRNGVIGSTRYENLLRLWRGRFSYLSQPLTSCRMHGRSRYENLLRLWRGGFSYLLSIKAGVNAWKIEVGSFILTHRPGPVGARTVNVRECGGRQSPNRATRLDGTPCRYKPDAPASECRGTRTHWGVGLYRPPATPGGGRSRNSGPD